MVTLGIDLSSMKEGTAACVIRWTNEHAEADPPQLHCDDKKLDEMIEGADVIGIDAPFGWPTDFVAAVKNWTFDSWDAELRDKMRFRETDRRVQAKLERPLLSVSSEKLALPAMRAMALLRRHGVKDRSGGRAFRGKRFFEVYPAGSLKEWELPFEGYKKTAADYRKIRGEILDGLQRNKSWLKVAAPDALLDSADALDAFVAALTARAAAQGKSLKPTETETPSAQSEGWIHLPTGLPTL